MGAPVFVRLDDDVRRELETEAQSRGVGLATLLRELATNAARATRRRRIYAEREQGGRYVRSSPAAREFYKFWGMPTTDAG